MSRRRALALALAAVVGGATVYVLLPFDGPTGRCRSAVVEAWPESGATRGWTTYVPDPDVFVDAFGTDLEAALCGAEARSRIAVPLLGAALVGLVLTGVRLRAAFSAPPD